MNQPKQMMYEHAYTIIFNDAHRMSVYYIVRGGFLLFVYPYMQYLHQSAGSGGGTWFEQCLKSLCPSILLVSKFGLIPNTIIG